MINDVVGNKLLPAGIRHDIIERTDGIPLFVEEMTKAVLEAESDGEARRTAAAIPVPVLAVPASLQASLMARLDRLGPAKEVAQIGAAIGREFSHALLSAVVSKPEPELASALERLMAAGLLFRQGAPPHANYLFKHALVQDASYGTLLREPRRALHARIAETLERQFTELAESQPELVARHCTEAGLVEKAAGLWGKAGQRSFERSALVEAAEQLRRALEQIANLPPNPALRREQIRLQVAIIAPLIHVKGYAAPETTAAVERARQLIEQAEILGEPPDDPLLLFSVLYGFWVANYVGFNGEAMRKLAAQFVALAEKQEAAVPRMIGHRVIAITLTCTGDFREALLHYDQSLALYDPSRHRTVAARFGHEPGVAVLSYRAIAHWLVGNPEAALRDSRAALKAAREIGQAATLMYALAHAAVPHILCGRYSAAAEQTQEVLALAEEKSAPHWKGFGMMNEGWLTALEGKHARAIELIATGIAVFRSTASTMWLPLRLSHLALAHAELNQTDDACRLLDEAMTAMETTKETWCEVEVHRIVGEVARLSGKPDTAEKHFDQATTVARQQQAKSWELRAAMSMARLWRDQGKRNEARDLLAGLCRWFTEGFDTLDLREAKAFLDELPL